MKRLVLSLLSILLCVSFLHSQQFTYNDTWGEPGLELRSSDEQKVTITHSISEWKLADITINRENVKAIELKGNMLPNNAGAPDVPGIGSMLAIPEGATAKVIVVNYQVEILQGVHLAVAPEIPYVTYDGALNYQKDETIWNNNALYPAEMALVSEPTEIRGVDAVMLGINPFRYNPVTKELRVYKNIELEIIFEGGNSRFGEDRLRSRYWDPLFNDMFLNASSLEEMEYSVKNKANRNIGCEYLIVVPDEPDFIFWADTLAKFRNMQGISTDVVTVTEIGGNTVPAIENYVNDIYNNWDIVPSAILLLGDYGAGSNRIISPIYSNYCASDNIFADVNGNHMPDFVFSRITAQNASQLETMVTKILEYETNPPTDPDFYDKPITALGWQTERWFQICIETVGGYFRNVQGKNPVRINEIYGGNPATDPWSTAPNTGTILNYFGPNGLGYLPATPGELGGWDGGNATMINNAINNGSFLLLHRDHGYELGWGEPDYNNNDINGLTNTELTFVYSVNCLTGKYNWGSECFTEKFHRHTSGGQNSGALGLVAASEVSYSFVNDVYVWGAFDNMFPDFMPDYGSTPEENGLLPSFSNSAGKYFLQQSNWPYNSGSKEVTYNLFHHHGGSFSTMYSEVPQDLLVVHNGAILGGISSYTVQADEGSLIALSVEGEIIGAAEGTGAPVSIGINPQVPGTMVDLVVTKTNYFRYTDEVLVISPDEPYVIYEEHAINDESGNDNGMIDYAEQPMLSLTVWNIGNEDALGTEVKLRSGNPYIIITDSTENYGDIPANQTAMVNDGFMFTVADTIPDQELILFNVIATDGDTTWTSFFTMTAHAPVMQLATFSINDEDGNNNGRIDPGETAEVVVNISNFGSSDAFDVMTELVCNDEYIEIQTGAQSYGDLMAGDSSENTFTVYAAENTPGGFSALFEVMITGENNIEGYSTFNSIVGKYTALVVDMDPNNNSGPIIMETFDDMDMIAQYTTSFPSNFDDYKSVFLSLGIHYSNHQLTDAEAGRLVDYLENGGKLYMEGRTTWYEDPQTALHPMFNMDVIEDTWFEYDTLWGREDAFTEDMAFEFDANQPYNNYYVEAIEPAFLIFQSQEVDYGSTVAFDEGTYKTIGSAFEFGGLVNGQPPSTKQQLMMEYLDFFGDILTDIEDPEYLTEAGNISVYPNPARDNVHFSINLTAKSEVSLEVFNVNGQKIATVYEGMMGKGSRDLTWNGSDDSGQEIPAGVYFYQLNTSDGVISGKVMIAQ